ncbi:MAG: transketolase [Gammaproteobacteria bacterium]|nr:transketolase [Gammaproteobacteria bacterium]
MNTTKKTLINKDIRTTLLKMVGRSGGSHIASAPSCVEIVNAVFKCMDLDKIINKQEDRDRIIFSKGHATSCLYSVMHHHGLFSQQQIDKYLVNGSNISGHTSHFLDYVEHSTGALGHGLSTALGIAIGSLTKGYNNRIFVVVGDGELHEGSNWEALMYAGDQAINNLCLLVDKNNYAQMHSIEQSVALEPLCKKLSAFNFYPITLDGHDEAAIIDTISTTKDSKKPIAIVCSTTKGKGVSFMENNNLWHYRSPVGEDLDNALAEVE